MAKCVSTTASGVYSIGFGRWGESLSARAKHLSLSCLSLVDHLANHGPYSEADAARLIREVASALAFLHGVDVVHADLKPENRTSRVCRIPCGA